LESPLGDVAPSTRASESHATAHYKHAPMPSADTAPPLCQVRWLALDATSPPPTESEREFHTHTPSSVHAADTTHSTSTAHTLSPALVAEMCLAAACVKSRGAAPAAEEMGVRDMGVCVSLSMGAQYDGEAEVDEFEDTLCALDCFPVEHRVHGPLVLPQVVCV